MKCSTERSSNSRVECQDSMTALSSAEPGRPIDWTMPSRSQAARTRPGQYTSAEFTRFCQSKRVRASVGRTGVCWDNAAAESFFAAPKNEMYYRQAFPTRARARFAVAGYIE